MYFRRSYLVANSWKLHSQVQDKKSAQTYYTHWWIMGTMVPNAEFSHMDAISTNSRKLFSFVTKSKYTVLGCGLSAITKVMK